MEYLADLLKRSEDFRIVVEFSQLEKCYHADLQYRARYQQWLHQVMGIGESIESAIESLNALKMAADGVRDQEG